MSFSEKLRDARKKSGLTQESLGYILHVSRQSITKWENGDAYPDAENLLQIAIKLETNLDTLFEEELNQNKSTGNDLSLEAESLLESNLLENVLKKRRKAEKLLNEIVNEEPVDRTVSTGIDIIDSIEGGFIRGGIYVLAGPICIGKTALALNIARNVAETGKVLWYSYRDTSKELYARLLAAEAGLPTSRRYMSGYSAKERDRLKSAIETILKKNLIIKEIFDRNLDGIREDISDESGQNSIIIIDSLADIDISDTKRSVCFLSKIARDSACPLLILDRTVAKEYCVDPRIQSSWINRNMVVNTIILNRRDYYDISYVRDDGYSICSLNIYDSELQNIRHGEVKFCIELCRFENQGE